MDLIPAFQTPHSTNNLPNDGEISPKEAIYTVGRYLLSDFKLEGLQCALNYEIIYKRLLEGTERNGKSLLLMGGLGTGKTLCMRVMNVLFRDTPRKFCYMRAYQFKDMLDEMKVSEIKASYGGAYHHDLYIDDLGFLSGDSNRYGNTINIIGEILLERYELWLSKGFRTHLSTNLAVRVDREKHPNVKTLTDLYGDRIADRISEMCEVVIFKGKSLRHG